MVALRSIWIAVFALALQACLFSGSSSGGKDKKPVVGRPHKAPTVTYETNDSLIEIWIQGSRTGEQGNFWIYRDDSLLSLPDYAGDLTGRHSYRLVDSVKGPGEYKYHVRYGSNEDSLGEKSQEYVYVYTGHSRSGRIRLSLESPVHPFPYVSLITPWNETLVGARFERKLGGDGKVQKLLAIEGPPSDGGYAFMDTDFVADDIMVYYRGSSLDGITEKWLDYSPWDSIRVKNKTWTYSPAVVISNLGTEVTAQVTNAPQGPEAPVYFLCRNSSASKTGRIRVDSMITAYIFQTTPLLADIPEKEGAYFYWVEAVDRWGRASVRSIPKEVKFTGRSVGPEITSLQVGNGGIQIQYAFSQTGVAFVLQRASDTTKAIADVDTLEPSFFGSAAFDTPLSSGFWFYRIRALNFDSTRSDPGPWARSPYYTFAPIYYEMNADIVNRGARVDATVEYMFTGYSVLFRSKSSTGRDSVAVDTLYAGDSPYTLSDKPPLGSWYYRVQRFGTESSSPNAIYRSQLIRVDFTGKVPGPSIRQIQVFAPYIRVTIMPDQEALAFILERSKDGEKDWTTCDTIPAGFSGDSFLNDKPPQDGFWNYRARGLMQGSTLTEYGTVMRTPKAWTFGVTYANTLSPTISNIGASVEVVLSSSIWSSATYLFRSATGDFKNGTKVDSSHTTNNYVSFRDAPPKGIWFYWVEQVPFEPGEYSVFRSISPVEIDFTGTPYISSLAKVSSGVRIAYPRTALSDTLEIWRTAGDIKDTASYALIRSLPAGDFTDYTVDESVSKTASVIYSYRLRVRREGSISDFGAAKSIYYEP